MGFMGWLVVTGQLAAIIMGCMDDRSSQGLGMGFMGWLVVTGQLAAIIMGCDG